MNELTAEWVAKAEGDFATAERELRARRRPNYDAVCFPAQQTSEKYLKAFLQEQAVSFPKTHSLIELLEITLPFDERLELQRELLVRPERCAVCYRCSSESAARNEAHAALRAAKSCGTSSGSIWAWDRCRVISAPLFDAPNTRSRVWALTSVCSPIRSSVDLSDYLITERAQ